MSTFSAFTGTLTGFNRTIYITGDVNSFIGEINGSILSAEAPNTSAIPQVFHNASGLPNPIFNEVICIINQFESSCF